MIIMIIMRWYYNDYNDYNRCRCVVLVSRCAVWLEGGNRSTLEPANLTVRGTSFLRYNRWRYDSTSRSPTPSRPSLLSLLSSLFSVLCSPFSVLCSLFAWQWVITRQTPDQPLTRKGTHWRRNAHTLFCLFVAWIVGPIVRRNSVWSGDQLCREWLPHQVSQPPSQEGRWLFFFLLSRFRNDI